MDQVKTELDESIKSGLFYVIRTLELEDKPNRDYRLLVARKLENYYQGNQILAYDYALNDWTDQGQVVAPRRPMEDDTDTDIPKHNNILRPIGESIIAALTPSLPKVKYFPEDAEEPEDILTSKSYSKIEELIAVRNNALQLLRKAIYIRSTQDYVTCYNYRLADEKYGTIKEPIYKFQKENRYDSNCPECGNELGRDETNPRVNPEICGNCQGEVVPETTQREERIPVIKEEITTPKSTEILEIYGASNVKISLQATNIQETPYLILSCEQHYTRMLDLFPHLKGQIGPGVSADDEYDRQVREPVLTPGYINNSNVTYKRCWLRPWAYNLINNDELVDQLKKDYPDGCCVSYVNDIFAEIYPESIDEHWTISQSPTSLKISSQPLLYDVLPMQDAKNEVFNLLIETLKYGIPLTIIDPRVLDLKEFKQIIATPGAMIPGKTPAGMNSLDSAVKVLQTANLPKEAYDLDAVVDRSSQYTSGALPSIWGGTRGNTKTLGQAELDHNQALQRLSLIWAEIVDFYIRVMAKAIPDYANGLLEDEKFTKEVGKGNFINVWIRKSEMQGKVGRILPEASTDFPVSWLQKRNTLMSILQLQNDVMNQVIFSPNNTGTVSEVLGFPGLYVPGEDQRFKQLVEFTELAKSAPQPSVDPMTQQPMIDPNTGQPRMQPSIPINPDLDNDEIHIATLQEKLNSEAGMELKTSNPPGYENALLHLKAHVQNQQMVQQQQMMQQAMTNQKPQGANNGESVPAQ